MTSICVIAAAKAVVQGEFILVAVIMVRLLDATCPIKSGLFYAVAVCVRACVHTCIHKHFTNQIKASTVDYWLLSQCVSALYSPINCCEEAVTGASPGLSAAADRMGV